MTNIEPPPDHEPATPDEPPNTPHSMWTRRFWLLTAERAIKTAAQVLAALLLAKITSAGGVDIAGIDWTTGLALALGAAALSVLTSLASRPVGPTSDDPSLV